MKKYLALSTTAFFAAAATLSAATYAFNTSDPTDINWNDIQWGGGAIPVNGDLIYIRVNNATSSTVTFSDADADKALSLSQLYLENYTKFVVGGSDTYKASLALTGNLVIKNDSVLHVGKNGTISSANNNEIKFENFTPTAAGVYRQAMVVDGGTVNGNAFNLYGLDGGEVIFKNGATYYKGNNDNPITLHNTAGRVKMTFDDSTYNAAYDAAISGGTSAWKNNAFYFAMNGTAIDSANDTHVDIVFQNGAVLNGAGVIANNGVTYYDFSGDSSKMTGGTGLNFAINSLNKETNYVRFSVLSGAKVSAGNLNMGNQGNSSGGFLETLVQGEAGKVSYLALQGSANLVLSSNTTIDQSANTFKQIFSAKGNTDIFIKGSFNVGSNETLGGKGYVRITGDNNKLVTQGSINLNAGWNMFNEAQNSIAEIYLYYGKDEQGNLATNSSWQFNGYNAYSSGNTKIYTVFDGNGGSNTINNIGDYSIQNAQKAGGNSTNTLVFTNGIVSSSTTKDIILRGRASGTASVHVTNGADITARYLDFKDYSTGSTGSTRFLLDSAKFTASNVYYNNAVAVDGVTEILVQGTGSVFTAGSIGMNYTQVEGSEHLNKLTMIGSGNTIALGSINFGDNNTGHTNREIYLKGDSATNKNRFFIQNDVVMQGSTVTTNATESNNFTIAGNTIFGKSESEGVVLKINEHSGIGYTSGVNTFTVKGTGNKVNISNLIVGNTLATTTGGQGTFRVEGGGSEINVSGEFKFRGARDSNGKLAGVAGKLELAIKDNGFSTIRVTGTNYEFTGLLEIDLSGITTNFEGVTQYYTLIIGGSGFDGKLSEYWFDFNTAKEYAENVRVITRHESDTYEFYLDGDDLSGWELVIAYTSFVPEPSTYVAIFGAIALAFAAYRRRFRKN